tara:strand:- start:707 stop:1294 length:588 start_codon:yes stop_codon:yes gene_type:complete
MSKTIEIRVVGYGQELVQGSFTDEEVEIFEKKMDETDETLGSIIFDIEDILPDSYGWFDRDEHTHVYGANVDGTTLYIIDGDEEIKIDNVWELEGEPYNAKVDSEEICHYDGTENIITTISNEKGWIMSGIIEIKGDEEFNISKLKLKIKDILFNDYENSLITDIIYDGEEICTDPDTSGKSFESYLERRESKDG